MDIQWQVLYQVPDIEKGRAKYLPVNIAKHKEGNTALTYIPYVPSQIPTTSHFSCSVGTHLHQVDPPLSDLQETTHHRSVGPHFRLFTKDSNDSMQK